MQHLLPKQDEVTKHVGSKFNKLDQSKLNYVIKMRQALCNPDIAFEDGSLNLKYFNTKKGHFWSK